MTAHEVPDVTISISFGAGGAVASTSSGRTDDTGPAPMAIESLGAGDSAGAPAPMTEAEMAIAQGRVGSGEPPGPMEIEQLTTAGSSVAPSPEPFGDLQTAGGPPGPLSLDALGLVAQGVDEQGDEAPSPTELPAQSASPRKRAAGRRQ